MSTAPIVGAPPRPGAFLLFLSAFRSSGVPGATSAWS